ncbi:MAG: hypothetical protein AAGD86_04900, partial [Pseudomonadota bacterium]
TQPALADSFFSLKIGSDTEISDPFGGGAAQQADPADIYQSGGAAGSLLGAAPYLDDALMFPGGDPMPVQGAPATAAPIGSAVAQYSDYLDIDGYDALDTRLSLLDVFSDPPLSTPILRDSLPLDCVQGARELRISYSDDSVAGWLAAAAPRVPTEGPSPFGAVYGTTAGQDEVLGLEVDLTGGFPATLLAVTPLADEATIHTDLAPNPGAGGQADDDIDALDTRTVSGCSVDYFSVDAEGRLALNPGVIYEFGGAGAPTPVISPAHLGVGAGVDLDAFEFAWLPLPNGQGQALAVLFSVAPDNPASPVLETGGLVPSTVYGSFMNGASFVVVDGPANGLDDVDAITHQPAPDSDGDGVADADDNCTLEPNPEQVDADGDGIGNHCDQDLNDDCQINFPDLAKFRAVFFTNDPVADFNVDGAVDFQDLAQLRRAFFSEPGPAADPNLCSP